MILNMYSVKDKAVDAYLQPFFAPSLGSAIRSVSDAVNDTQHQFSKHITDYTLWHLGTFDDATGLIVSDGPDRVCALTELVKNIG